MSFFDLHIHPTIKPFGHFCKQLLKKGLPIDAATIRYDNLKQNHPKLLDLLYDGHNEESLWNDKRPNPILNPKFGELAFAKYSQSNFTSAINGRCKVVCVGMYPIEKEFLKPTLGQRLTGLTFLKNFVTGVTSCRIKYIQSAEYKYFQDVEAEYEFLKTSSIELSKQGQKLIIAASFKDVEEAINSQQECVVAIPAVEGANVFYPTRDIVAEHLPQVLENIRKMKAWQHPPLYISLAHHFYNGFVSHEQSLVKFISIIGNINQKPGMQQKLSGIKDFNYFTKEGIEVVNALLSTDNGRRIIIDVKHMDARARVEYYQFLEREHQNKVPVVVSHAAVGITTPEKWFNTWTLNLNNADIDAVWRTNGLIGVELDQRILGFDELKTYKKDKGLKFDKMSAEFNSELVWNAICAIATRCAENNKQHQVSGNPWRNISIGSDYDGLINPINKFATLESYLSLEDLLVTHARRYLADKSTELSNQTLQTPEELVRCIMHTNGMEFLRCNFK